MNASIKKFVVAASLLVATCTFADSAEIVNVEGRGVGANKAEALKDAYRDAVERAVGMYVDAEQKMKNDELVEDQILTQSNAYIEKYEVVKEKTKPNGLVEIRINAEVKKSALTKKLSDMMPKQTFALGDDTQNIHSRVVTKEKRNVDAAALLENALKNFNPVTQLMKLSLSGSRPILKSIDGRFVRKGREVRNPGEKNRVFYRFRFEVDEQKYYGEFLPPLLKVLDQIALKPARNVRLKSTPLENKYLLDMKHLYLSGEWEHRDSSGAIYQQDVWDDGRLGGGLACYYPGGGDGGNVDDGVYIDEVSLSDANGMSWHLSCSGGQNSRRLKACRHFETPDRLASDGVFHVLVITKMNSARTIVQARDYGIPPECAAVVQKWQADYFIASGRHRETAYNIIFADGDGEEMCSSPVSFKNSSLANVFLGSIDTNHGRGRFTAWHVTPMVHCDAAALERWIGFDIQLDQLPNIKSVTVELAE